MVWNFYRPFAELRSNIRIGALLDTSVDAFKATYEVNTFAVVRLARTVFPSMATRKSGLIVNLGSVGGDM